MSSALAPSELDRARRAVTEALGLQIADDAIPRFVAALRERMDATGIADVAAYIDRLRTPAHARAERRALALALTIGETYFLRNAAQFAAFADIAVPNVAHEAEARGGLRVLSAGCSSGEEPYSIAIVLREQRPSYAIRARIVGIDANVVSLAKATAGRYTAWSLRETPAELRARHFRAEGRDLVLANEVRRMVAFEERNLAEDDAVFWAPGAFDIVFCRNVLMYFAPAAARAVIARITRALTPGGYLFLGHVETLRELSDDYDLCHTHETFYYRRRDIVRSLRVPPPTASEIEPPAPPASFQADAWMDAIQRASERIERLANERRANERIEVREATPESATGKASIDERPTDEQPIDEVAIHASADLDPVIELLRKERFTEALDRLHALPAPRLARPDAQLLLAVLLTNTRDPDHAEEVCRALLARDDRNAGAHYLTALCRERAGDLDAAAENDRAATKIDPSFAMPRLHLGLLAKRARDRDAARTELREALFLLGREDASRLVLFGGGFGREALVRLCRAELRALGVADD